MTFPFVIESQHLADWTRHGKSLVLPASRKTKMVFAAAKTIALSGLGVSTVSALYLATAAHPAAWILVAMVFGVWAYLIRVAIIDRRRAARFPMDRRRGEFSITQRGIDCHFADGFTIEVDWPGFTTWLATEHSALLFDTTGYVTIMPLADAATREKVLSWLNERLGDPVKV